MPTPIPGLVADPRISGPLDPGFPDPEELQPGHGPGWSSRGFSGVQPLMGGLEDQAVRDRVLLSRSWLKATVLWELLPVGEI
ncbi:hypothetical protein GCM10009579_31570 [Streptomyces javensis]|uniref:Uncharacterized protein n=1 Tax=Streptomyces javensis TaxID=114698 RepID=A0ABN1X0E3_9ACTN